MEENKDIKEAKEELERISQDDILRRKALNRTLEIADKLQLKKEAKEAREKGLSDGLVTGEKIAMSHTIFGFNCAICLRLFDSVVRSFHLA